MKRAGWYASPDFVPRRTPEQEAFFGPLLPAHGSLVPADAGAVTLEVRRSKIAGAQAAFDALVGLGELVRVGTHLYRAEQLAEVRARLERTLRAEGRMTAARFRDVVGTTRKYAVPLLEYFDAAGVTERDGDERVLRSSG